MRRERRRRRGEEKRRNKKKRKEKRLGKNIYFLEESPPLPLFRRIGEIFWFFWIKRIKKCVWGEFMAMGGGYNPWQFPWVGWLRKYLPPVLRLLEEDRKLAEEKKKAEDAAKRAAGIKTEADAISVNIKGLLT